MFIRNEIDNGSIASWDVPCISGKEAGFWVSPFRLATKIVVELSVWRTSKI